MRKANPINIRGIDHVVLRVLDLDKMISFYCDVLGCKLERGPGRGQLAQLRAGRSLIDLMDAKGSLGERSGGIPHPNSQNMDHLCLQIHPWNLTRIQEHLREHGLVIGEPVPRYGALGNGPSIYFDDPEGNTVELKGP